MISLEASKVRFGAFFQTITPQPLYNTIVGVQANFRVSYPKRVIYEEYNCIGIRVLNRHFGSNPDPCYIQNSVINRVELCYKEVQV